MRIVMTDPEQDMFREILGRAHILIEWGSGGSTFLASKLIAGSITSIDSSREWLQNVSTACSPEGAANLQLIYVDIGPVKAWGRPLNNSHRDHWPDYHTGVWKQIQNPQADTFLIDGRFRVACFMQALKHAGPHSVILVHDYNIKKRPYYSVMGEVAEEVNSRDSLSAFKRRPNFDLQRVDHELQKHCYDYR